MDLISKNAYFFNRCVKKCQRALDKGKLNAALGWAVCAGRMGWKAHPGFYVSPELENLLLDVGRKIPDGKDSERRIVKTEKRHWLHVMTAAAGSGGHTRFVEKWIRRQLCINDDTHSVVLLEQKKSEVPDWLYEAVETAQ